MNTAYNEKGLNPFTAIWTRPRETMRYVIEEKSSNFIFWIVALTGFAGAILGSQGTEQSLPLGGVLLAAAIFGPIGGAIGLTISSGIFLLVGKLFSGEATFKEMFRALATAQIIQIWLAPVLLMWMFLSPETFFLNEGEVFWGGDTAIEIIMAVVLAVFSVWLFVLQCKAVGEAHGLSAWKGFFIVLIPGVILLIGLLLLLFSIAGTL